VHGVLLPQTATSIPARIARSTRQVSVEEPRRPPGPFCSVLLVSLQRTPVPGSGKRQGLCLEQIGQTPASRQGTVKENNGAGGLETNRNRKSPEAESVSHGQSLSPGKTCQETRKRRRPLDRLTGTRDACKRPWEVRAQWRSTAEGQGVGPAQRYGSQRTKRCLVNQRQKGAALDGGPAKRKGGSFLREGEAPGPPRSGEEGILLDGECAMCNKST
jgi:hypothetical protein